MGAVLRGSGLDRCTHKSLKGNNFATPPRTMKAATAKFTMRLQNVSYVKPNANGSAGHCCLEQSSSLAELHCRKYIQDVGEVHGGGGKMWIAQFGGR